MEACVWKYPIESVLASSSGFCKIADLPSLSVTVHSLTV
jgi:hypothetical protein